MRKKCSRDQEKQKKSESQRVKAVNLQKIVKSQKQFINVCNRSYNKLKQLKCIMEQK